MEEKDRAAGQEDHALADFVPDELDEIPADASGETKLLYLVAIAVQIGQIAVTVWGLDRLSDPSVGTWGKIGAGAAIIVAIGICLNAWSSAYHSAAWDEHRPKPE
ncbi:hypothetical protein [Micromonospora sp. NPDC003241]